jgi:dihydrodipicolinate synthase/N-acetylneuraminate lyase
MTPAGAAIETAVRGSIPALLTPFRDGGRRIDLTSLDRHLEWLQAAGIGAVLVAGTTGEGQSLSVSERVEIVGRVKSRHPQLAVMAGTGFNALPDTLDASLRALNLGADSLLVTPPCFFPADEEEVLAYFAALLRELPEHARLILYHIPRYTGAPIPIDAVRRLREEFGPTVAGLKDSGGERAYFEDALRDLPDLAVYGSDGVAALSYAEGAVGVVSALANVVPGDFLAMEAAMADGGGAPADIEARLGELRSLTHSVPQRSGLKHLVHVAAGIPVSSARAPELELSADQVAALEASGVVQRLTGAEG